jgi:5'-3' exonuclease
MKIKTLLVDSSFLLKRSYHGAQNVYTDAFGHIGGLYQFMTKLRKLIKENQINKVVLAWDGENGGIYRHNIDPAYKANRKDKKWNEKIVMTDYDIRKEKEKEESILKQRKRIQAYAEELFLRQIEVDNVEADDLIAAYCIDNHNIEDIIIYTNDRDFAQLLDLNIKIIFDNIDIIIDKDSFFLNFPYDYKNALTMKIICGDTSDNIAGVPRLQEKGLLKQFPDLKKRYMSVKEICAEADRINMERVKNKKKPLQALTSLLENVDRLKMNHQLINLREPFLNDEAEEELEQLAFPLSDENRGAKNLVKLMTEDQFLTVYGGNFVSYVEPFYPIIMNEKKILKDFLKEEKKQLRG